MHATVLVESKVGRDPTGKTQLLAKRIKNKSDSKYRNLFLLVPPRQINIRSLKQRNYGEIQTLPPGPKSTLNSPASQARYIHSCHDVLLL